MTAETAPVLPPKPAPSRRGVRLLRRAAWVLGAGLTLVVLAGLFRDPLLRAMVEADLRRETGLQADIGALHLGLTSASLRIRDLRLKNPPGYVEENLLVVPEIFVQLRASTNGSGVAFREIRLHIATLNVVKNSQGEFNLRSLEKPAKKRRARAKRKQREDRFTTIDKITLTLGEVNYIDMAKPRRNQRLDLAINQATATHLSNEEELKAWLGGLLTRLVVREVFRDPPPMRLFWRWLLQNPSSS